MKASLTNWKVTAQFVNNYYKTLPSQASSAGYEKNPEAADMYKVEEVMQVFTGQWHQVGQTPRTG